MRLKSRIPHRGRAPPSISQLSRKNQQLKFRRKSTIRRVASNKPKNAEGNTIYKSHKKVDGESFGIRTNFLKIKKIIIVKHLYSEGQLTNVRKVFF